MTIIEQKNALRQKVKLLLSQLSTEDVLAKSTAIFEQVEQLEEFKNAQNILVYSSLPTEVQTRDFLQKWSGEKNIFLPIVHGDELLIGKFGELKTGSSFGILEPENALTEIPPLNLAIIPGLAFDKHNNRMGRGKGYYDKFLKINNLYKVGVCFSCQLFDEMPHEDFDVKMDKIIFD